MKSNADFRASVYKKAEIEKQKIHDRKRNISIVMSFCVCTVIVTVFLFANKNDNLIYDATGASFDAVPTVAADAGNGGDNGSDFEYRSNAIAGNDDVAEAAKETQASESLNEEGDVKMFATPAENAFADGFFMPETQTILSAACNSSVKYIDFTDYAFIVSDESAKSDGEQGEPDVTVVNNAIDLQVYDNEGMVKIDFDSQSAIVVALDGRDENGRFTCHIISSILDNGFQIVISLTENEIEKPNSGFVKEYLIAVVSKADYDEAEFVIE